MKLIHSGELEVGDLVKFMIDDKNLWEIKKLTKKYVYFEILKPVNLLSKRKHGFQLYLFCRA